MPGTFFRAAAPEDYPPGSPRQHTLTGDFQIIRRFRSRLLSCSRDILIYLPPGYHHQPGRRYPVLYLQDGQNLFDGATSYVPGQEWHVDETAERLIRARAVEPLIIVGIYNAGSQRVDEYTPTVDPRSGRGGKAGRYARMLVEELKPLIDSRYRTYRGPSNTGLGGSSLGGLVSLATGLSHPHVFGKLAVISPSVWWDEEVILRRVRASTEKPSLKIWLDMGTAEGPDPGRSLQDSRNLRDALIANGWVEGHDLNYHEAWGAGHNEAAWAYRFGDILRFLFPLRRTQPGE